MKPPVYGVGLTFSSGVDPLLHEDASLVDVVEVEPETLWIPSLPGGVPYRVDEASLQRLVECPQPKLTHAVAFPVGGSRPPDAEHIPPLLHTLTALQPGWTSAHLAFNQVGISGTSGYSTSFLLPPLQTPAGVRAAVESIRSVSSLLPFPFAVETGVNYLKPRGGEMDDGAFLAEVTTAADCGILLDLHNLWANARNGRQSVEAFLDQIPLERVWEIHLAGGFEHRNYWVDSHSGAIPPEVRELCQKVLPRLPNLGALIFEIFPSYVPLAGLDRVREQLRWMHQTWNEAGLPKAKEAA